MGKTSLYIEGQVSKLLNDPKFIVSYASIHTPLKQLERTLSERNSQSSVSITFNKAVLAQLNELEEKIESHIKKTKRWDISHKAQLSHLLDYVEAKKKEFSHQTLYET